MEGVALAFAPLFDSPPRPRYLWLCVTRTEADAGEDARLVARIAGGDRQALGSLYDRYAPHLLALARRVLEHLGWKCTTISLTDHLGPRLSQAATAHALARLSRK